MEPLNFLTTMHKDEVCMHFRSALAEQMVKRVLHVWPLIQEVVHLCFTFPLLRATRHSPRYVQYKYTEHCSGTTEVVCLRIKRKPESCS